MIFCAKVGKGGIRMHTASIHKILRLIASAILIASAGSGGLDKPLAMKTSAKNKDSHPNQMQA